MSDPMLPEGLGLDAISLFQPAIHPLRDPEGAFAPGTIGDGERV